MNEAEIISLLEKYKAGTLNREEHTKLESWYINEADNSTSELSPAEVKESLAMLRSRLPLVYERKRTTLWPKLAAAAAVIFVVGIALWFFGNNQTVNISFTPDKVASNEILPGKHTARLMLAPGRVLELSDAKTGLVIDATKLSYNDGSPLAGAVTDNNDWISVATPKGGTYEVVLPDRTKVWLNAGSELFFPRRFSGKLRKVTLTGEAYFEVAKDKAHPFLVGTNNQELEVLGTHFNISAYLNEDQIKTTLLEGAVKISAYDRVTNDPVKATRPVVTILKPKQQSVVDKDSRTLLAIANTAAVMAWKNGDFVFEGETLEGIMREVERWYNVEVVYASDAPRQLRLEGVVSRSRSIDAVLERMAATGSVKFKINGRKIIVTK